MGFSAFARHYLRNHYCFLFLQVLRCFSSLGFPLLLGYWSSTSRVSPFRHLRINARLQLPVAFRSLPRLSSSLRAKASPIRPYSLPFLLLSTCITHLTLSCNSEKSQKRKLLNLNDSLVILFSLLAKLVNELFIKIFLKKIDFNKVEDKRFELLTPCVQGRCSSQLS